MDDPRIELADLAVEADGEHVLGALDGVRIVVEAPPERCQSRNDQVALYSIVNLCARLFSHLELRLVAGVPAVLDEFLEGDLTAALTGLAGALRPEPSREPDEDLHLAFGMEPSGPGLAADAAGWTYSIGPALQTLTPAPGPPFGAIAAASYVVARALADRLAPLGLPVGPSVGVTANLLDFGHSVAPAPPAFEPRLAALPLVGCGSLGSSLVLAARLAGIGGGPLDLIDPDRFSQRNRLRYPVLRSEIRDPKAEWLAAFAELGGLDARPHVGDIASFLAEFAEPPAIGLAVVSVDTVEGRRDATDVLARRTISGGVDALRLHVSTHGFADGGPCAYCQYVDVAPTLSGAGQLAQMIGLEEARVVAIELAGGRIEATDAERIAAAGLISGAPPQAGDRLADLRRRVYAQAAIPAAGGEAAVLVSAPFVSQLAGLLMLVEAVKESCEELAPFRLGGRYDVDLTGPPPAFVRRVDRDQSGRCLCHSPFRGRAYRGLHGI